MAVDEGRRESDSAVRQSRRVRPGRLLESLGDPGDGTATVECGYVGSPSARSDDERTGRSAWPAGILIADESERPAVMDLEQVQSCSLTEEGRAKADGIAHCYVETTYDGGDYDDPDDCRAIAKYEGFEHINSGVGRDAYRIPDEYVDGDYACVIKFPRNLEGGMENQREVRSWQRAPDEVKRHLAPIVDENAGWLVMIHAERDIDAKRIEQVQAEFGNTGWVCEDSNEAHNLGVIDGDPVIIDYGMGVYEADSLEEADELVGAP